MKSSSNLLIIVSALLAFLSKLVFTDATALIHEVPVLESTGSDEYNLSSHSEDDIEIPPIQKLFPSTMRRHHLKFGVRGKRYSYGYLGKRTNVPQINDYLEEWLSNIRERRAGRPQYGILG